MTAVPDIPRLYTALAECLATLLYARQLAPRYSARHSTVNSLIWMAGLAVFMQLTGSVPLVLWLPCMVAAIGSMYLFLWRTCETTPLEAGYYCARAFILAELAASVEWQLHCALWPQRTGRDPLAVKSLDIPGAGLRGVIQATYLLHMANIYNEGIFYYYAKHTEGTV